MLTEEELARHIQGQKEFTQALVDNTLDILAVIDAAGILTYISPSVTKALGYAQDELIGNNAYDHIHPDDRPRMDERRARLLQGIPLADTGYYRFACKDGSWRVMESRSVDLRDNPHVNGFLVMIHDMSGLRDRYEELAVLLNLPRP